MEIFVTFTAAQVLEAKVRRPRRWQMVAGLFLILSVVLFVSGFLFSGPIVAQSEVPKSYLAEQKGGRFYAVKHRGGEKPPSFEINETQYRLWKHGESIHAFFHFGACFCFLIAWVIGVCTQRNCAAKAS